MSIGDLSIPQFARHVQAAAHAESSLRDASVAGLLHTERDVRRFEHFVVLDALVYPYAEWAGLRAAGGFNQWLFFLDDQYDDDPSVMADADRVRNLLGRAFDVLSTGRMPFDPSPFDRFTVEIRRRIRTASPGAFWARFLDDVHDYLFLGSMLALEAWREQRVPTPTVYRELRRHDSGMACVIDLAELAANDPLTPAILSRPEVQRLRRATADHVAFLNDLVSYDKEVVRAGSTFNLVHAVAVHETGGDVRAAVVRVMAELDRVLADFEAAATAATGPGARHAAALRHWISGNHRFSLHGGRYHHAQAHLVELRGEPTETPPPLRDRSLAYLS